ncbi:hypothetical protein FHX06_005969 [Rhizobium sp. BK512]|jgi:hypothetical protein|nr:hypothetical protein [Rhizobium sp. BK379]MBB3564605.1 hypothetical protein [Rhizobium sp. BK512]
MLASKPVGQGGIAQFEVRVSKVGKHPPRDPAPTTSETHNCSYLLPKAGQASLCGR